MNEPDLPPEGFGPDNVLVGGCGFELALGGLALLLGWIFGPDPLATIPGIDQPSHLIRDVFCGTLAAIPWLILVAMLDRMPWHWVRELRESSLLIVEMLRSVSVPGLAVLALSAGVGEELLFRGWLQVWLGGGPDQADTTILLLSIGGASLAFGLVHSLSRFYVLFALVMGIYPGQIIFSHCVTF